MAELGPGLKDPRKFEFFLSPLEKLASEVPDAVTQTLLLQEYPYYSDANMVILRVEQLFKRASLSIRYESFKIVNKSTTSNLISWE